jgi:hypothetical protein
MAYRNREPMGEQERQERLDGRWAKRQNGIYVKKDWLEVRASKMLDDAAAREARYRSGRSWSRKRRLR